MHNIPSALSLGNRTIMMNNGCIVMELEGQERATMTTEKLLQKFWKKKLSSNAGPFTRAIPSPGRRILKNAI